MPYTDVRRFHELIAPIQAGETRWLLQAVNHAQQGEAARRYLERLARVHAGPEVVDESTDVYESVGDLRETIEQVYGSNRVRIGQIVGDA